MVSGISKTIYEIIIIFPLLIFPLLLGFIHWKVLSPTRHSCYRWMLGYLLAAVLGFIIGALVSEWLYPSGPDEFTTSYLYSETLPYYLSLGLGIGIAQFLLLRSEIRYPLLLVVSTTLGIFLAWEIQMSSWGYDVGRQYSPHLDGLMLLVVMGAVANSLTGILAALLHRRPFKIEHTAA
jgi:peptidoglycan/LPS O-acetylase OafA/YrhL